MLTIPDEIKELLHQDTCRKNIRIHFPNGERSDICNGLIVKDSVSYTESLCSQDKLRFGLCESPVFECETVGVGNIKGATIHVFCEIFCESTVSDAVFQQDLQAYVYQIPYGVFIVASAKRQADLIHRKIVAYNILATYDFRFTPYQLYRSSYKASSNMDFDQQILGMIIENVQSDPFNCVETELTPTEIIDPLTYCKIGPVYPLPQPGYYTQRGWFDKSYYLAYRITASNSNKLYRIVVDNGYTGEFKALVDLKYVNYELYWGNYGDHQQTITGLTIRTNQTSTENKYTQLWKGDFFYPYMSLPSADNNAIYKPSSAQNEGVYLIIQYKKDTLVKTFTGSHGGGSYDSHTDTTIYCDPSDVHIYELTLPDAYTFSWMRAKDNTSKYTVPNPEQIDLRELFEGYVESMGLFGGINRYGDFYTLNIQQQFILTPSNALYPAGSLYPQGVTGGKLLPQDYQSCWYDDEYTKPFGAVECAYKDSNNVDCLYRLYLTGFDDDTDPNSYQVYSLEGNYLIQNSKWAEADIQAICNTIATNIDGVRYMPVDFVGRGLPYVEPGDTFEILTKLNDSITTIVLNRTISGEQTLTDSYKSI